MKQQIRNNKLIDYLHEYDDSYHKYEYKDFLDNFIEVITQLTVEDKDIRLDGFGVFTTRFTPEKTNTNPRTGERVMMPESRTLKFVTSVTFQEKFKKMFREFKLNKEKQL